MSKIKITERDFLVFVLGVLTMLVVEVAFDWNNSKKAFMDGWNGYNSEALLSDKKIPVETLVE